MYVPEGAVLAGRKNAIATVRGFFVARGSCCRLDPDHPDPRWWLGWWRCACDDMSCMEEPKEDVCSKSFFLMCRLGCLNNL